MPRRTTSATTTRDSVSHPLFARFYARCGPLADTRAGFAAHRAELLAGLSGRVIEIGAGSGLTFRQAPCGRPGSSCSSCAGRGFPFTSWRWPGSRLPDASIWILYLLVCTVGAWRPRPRTV